MLCDKNFMKTYFIQGEADEDIHQTSNCRMGSRIHSEKIFPFCIIDHS